MTRRRLVLMLGVAAWAGAPGPARAYNEAIHALLDERSPPAALAERTVEPPTAGAMAALRATLWQLGATHPDDAVRAAFLARWPEPGKFDRWALKELLGFAPEKAVFGIDRLPDAPARAIGGLLTAGAREPDDDGRNRERYAHDATRAIRKDRWDRPLPRDPKQLDLGGRTGSSSQAWAHYGLPDVAFSADPAVLKAEPWRWSYATAPRAQAADHAQLLTDLALCAASLDDPAGEGLAWLVVGQAHHYVEDVANQIHTLQAIYPFFFDAKLEAIKEDLASVGGLLRARPSFVDVGLQIITNHHLVGENLFAERVDDVVRGRTADPRVAAAVAAITTGDPTLEAELDALALAPDGAFARAITQAVIERSSREGGALYEATRAVVSPRLSRAGVAYEDATPAAPWARPEAPAEAWDRFYALQAAGFARAGSALRRHVALVDGALAPGRTEPAARRRLRDLAGRRLLATRIAELAADEARLAAWDPPPPASAGVTWWVPGLYAGLLGVLGLGVWWLRRRRGQAPSGGKVEPASPP